MLLVPRNHNGSATELLCILMDLLDICGTPLALPLLTISQLPCCAIDSDLPRPQARKSELSSISRNIPFKPFASIPSQLSPTPGSDLSAAGTLVKQATV